MSVDLDNLLMQLGRYGKWQILSYLLICLAFNWPVTWQIFAIVFAAAVPEHHCKVAANATLNETLPLTTIGRKVTWSQCQMYSNGSESPAVSCRNGWTYEKDFESSIVTDWDLVCDREIYPSVAHTLMMAGALVASFLSPLSDKFGRKPMFLVCLWATGIAGVSNAFAPSIEWFMALQFVRGLTFMGVITSGLVMACELFPSDQRIITGILVQFFWASGLMTLAGWAYLIRNWVWFMVAISVPIALTIPYSCLISESIPWMIMKGRFESAKQTLEKAAKLNKIKINLKELEAVEKASLIEDIGGKYTSVFAIFTAPYMRRYTFIVIYLCIAVNFVYWGLAFGTANLGGDRYLNFFINGAVELPAVFICYVTVPRFGRRYNMMFFYMLAAAALVAMVFVPVDKGQSMVIVQTVCAMIGKFGASAVYLNIVFYMNEVYPTTHRNVGVGVTFVMGLIAGAIAPYAAAAAKTAYWLPSVLFAACSVLGGLAMLLMPETVDRPLPDTIEEIQDWSLSVSRSEKIAFRDEMKEKRRSSKDLRLSISSDPEGPSKDVICHTPSDAQIYANGEVSDKRNGATTTHGHVNPAFDSTRL